MTNYDRIKQMLMQNIFVGIDRSLIIHEKKDVIKNHFNTQQICLFFIGCHIIVKYKAFDWLFAKFWMETMKREWIYYEHACHGLRLSLQGSGVPYATNIQVVNFLLDWLQYVVARTPYYLYVIILEHIQIIVDLYYVWMTARIRNFITK